MLKKLIFCAQKNLDEQKMTIEIEIKKLVEQAKKNELAAELIEYDCNHVKKFPGQYFKAQFENLIK